MQPATLYPNQLWRLDHYTLDLVVADSSAHKLRNRPKLTLVMDDFSRAICGLHLGLRTPDGLSTAIALSHAMLPKTQPDWIMCGIPEALRLDLGVGSRSKQLEDICRDCGIKLIHASPNTPLTPGKIERWFSVLDRGLQSALSARPQRQQQKGGHYPSLAEVEMLIVTFLLDEYHKRVHTVTKAAPQTRWLEGQCTKAIRMVENKDTLDLLLPLVKQRENLANLDS